MEQRSQPPPQMGYQPERQSEAPYPEVSQVKGWVRLTPRGKRWEVYWKGRNDVMLLMAHSLSYGNADSLKRELEAVLKRYHNIPFEESDVQHVTVQDHQQTQDHVEGSMEKGTAD